MSSTTPPPTDPGDESGTSPPPPPSSEPTGATGGPPPPPGQPGTGPAGGAPGQAPQGLAPSSIGKRIGAYLIDAIGMGIVIGIVFVAIFVPIGIASRGNAMPFGGGFGVGWLWSLVSAGIFLAYFVFMEGTRGQTVGKMLLSMKVYKYDGSAMDVEGAFKRRFWFVLGPILPIPVLNSLVGLGIVIWLLVTMSNDEMNRGYHDVFANTIVVDET